MRRSDREVKSREEIEAVLEEADACRLAFAAGGEPYIVVMNYGFSWDAELPVLYFHCARQGRKLDAMRANPRVCFELDSGHELATGDSPCSWGMNYRSVVGYGRLSELEAAEERRAAMDSIMRHYGWTGPAEYEVPVLGMTTVLRLEVEELTGKKRG